MPRRASTRPGCGGARERRSGAGPVEGPPTGPLSRSLTCKAVFAAAEALAGEDRAVGVAHLLAALAEDVDVVTTRIIRQGGGRPRSSARLCSRRRWSAEAAPVPAGHAPAVVPAAPPGTPTLDRFGRDLTALARKGELGPIIGRRREILAVLQTLARSSKNNPVLVGEAGVGKTAVVEAIAIRAAEGKDPAVLAGKRIVELSVGALLGGDGVPRGLRGAGAGRHRGGARPPGGHRLHRRAARARRRRAGGAGRPRRREPAEARPRPGRPALHRGDHHRGVPPLHRVRLRARAPLREGAGRGAGPGRDARDPEGPAPAARAPPRRHAARRVAGGGPRPLGALRARPEAAGQGHRPRGQGGGADAAAHAEPRPPAARADRALAGEAPPVTPVIVARVLAEKRRLPLDLVTDTLDSGMGSRLLALEGFLRERVLGQEEAIARVSRRLRLAFASPRGRRGPAAVLLFLGPSGVGKTETARAPRRAPLRLRVRHDPDRHVGAHGGAQRLQADRVAAGLRRPRRGGPAHRRHPLEAARAAAARRGREGPPARARRVPPALRRGPAHRREGPARRRPAARRGDDLEPRGRGGAPRAGVHPPGPQRLRAPRARPARGLPPRAAEPDRRDHHLPRARPRRRRDDRGAGARRAHLGGGAPPRRARPGDARGGALRRPAGDPRLARRARGEADRRAAGQRAPERARPHRQADPPHGVGRGLRRGRHLPPARGLARRSSA